MSSVRTRRTYKNYADIYSELHLLPSAPRQVIDAAYRALSRMYHPDLQEGEELSEAERQRLHEAQLRTNAAYKKIVANLTEEADPGR